MEKRRVRKRDKVVVTRKGNFVLKLARGLVRSLRLYCKRIMVVGSICRKEKNPVDIDIVLIPKDKDKLEKFMEKKGKFV